MRRARAGIAVVAGVAALAFAGCGANSIEKINDDQWIIFEVNGKYDLNDIKRTCEAEGRYLESERDVSGEGESSVGVITCGDRR